MNPRANDPSQPLHPRLIAPGAALLIAAFATDVMYWRTLLFQWDNFSVWLIAGGLVLAALAGLAILLDAARRRLGAMAWGRFAGFTVAALLSLLNVFVHTRDAYTAVVPDGLELSALVTAILIVLGWRGWSLRAVPRPRPFKPREVRS
ncbi:DUF2231 domain-containing protein [Phenylobacterium sp.]|jgi:uncharacterized membrane protein|uniref:DUF2231 domain-containing protein n=1 Tax=Phenylobacterium sp. TaxID=1871053 RepID=UPI0012255180|nr:DUF2231 domain-containing protein [Phenylobacterium sp.]THD60246.1 MAG: DUF2231 domain-containing protein [Phenylobacterium sp.]